MSPPRAAPWFQRPATLAGLLVALVFTLLFCWVLSLDAIPARAAYDQKYYHEPTIRGFARQLPAIDVWDYLSATTPGYHVVLAAASKVVGTRTETLMACSACFTLVLLALLAVGVTRRIEAREDAGTPPERIIALGVALTLPLLGSIYVVQSGMFLLPDNAGWLGVLGVTLLALREKWSWQGAVCGGAVLLALVLTRQVHLWSASMLWAAAWLHARQGEAGPTQSRTRRLMIAGLATLPAVVGVLLFVRYWGGLVPPRFAEQLQGPTILQALRGPAPALMLATLGLCAPFFVGWWGGAFLRLARSSPALVVGVLLAALVALIVPETTYNVDAGRRSGLWNMTRHAPVLAGHTSTLMLGLGLVGAAAVLALVWSQRSRRAGWILLVGLGALTAAQSMSAQMWQRYLEAFVLMTLALLAAGTRQGGFSCEGLLRPLRWLGPLALFAAYGAYSFRDLQTSASRLHDPPPPIKDVLDHQGVQPPALLPRPEKPAGRTFWGW